MGLKEYLTSVKESLADLPTRRKVHIVIGNESCDLDSAISAITYAYYLHQIKAKPGTNYVPVLNTPQDQFRLKLETVFFLGKHGIRPRDLTFISDLDLAALTQQQPGGGGGSDVSLAVTLVDHHVLSEKEACLWPHVVQVFDHRPQNGPLPDSWTVTLEHVGSCCSLVARELLASDTFELDATVAELLLGTILTDTGNMSASDHIGTPADHEQLVKLKTFLPPSISATSIYEEIRNSKFDLSSLTVKEMLQKDLKVLKGTQLTVAMSSITKDLEEILCAPDFTASVTEFCGELPADAVIILTIMMGDGGIRRRCLAIFSPTKVHQEQITDLLLGSTSPNLELQPLTTSGNLDISAFIQNNTIISRKGILPVVDEFLSGSTEASSPSANFFSGQDLSENASFLPETSAGGDFGKSPDKSVGGDGGETEDQAGRHINLSKVYQSEQFRTSQDQFDLAALGANALISPSLSSDSDLGNLAVSGFSRSDNPGVEGFVGGGLASLESSAVDGGESRSGTVPGAEFNGRASVRNVDAEDFSKKTDQSPPGSADLSCDTGESGASQVEPGIHVNPQRQTSTGSEGKAEGNLNGSSVNTPPIVINCHTPLMDQRSASDSLMTDLYNTNSSMPTSGQGSKVPSYPETPPNSYMGSSFSLNRETQLPSFNSSEMVKRIQQKKAALAGHSGQHRMNLDDDDDDSFGLTISAGGGDSLVSPAVPQNSYVDPSSGFDFMSSPSSGHGGEFPRLSSSEVLLERVNEKRSQFGWSLDEPSAARREQGEDLEEDPIGTAHRLEYREDRCGSLDPPVPYTPQNSYVDGGFDAFSRSNLPSMNSAEMVDRIRAKQSAMFGSSNSTGNSSRVSHGSDDSGGCHSPDVLIAGGGGGGDGGAGDRGVPVHNSNKTSRGMSLDSPQQPYTPQNSYRDSMGLLEYKSRLPDLNEVAERLSTERQADQGPPNSSVDDEEDRGQSTGLDRKDLGAAGPNPSKILGGGETNLDGPSGSGNLPPLAAPGVALLSSSPHHHHHHHPPPSGSPRKSSSRSQSDSQNTMSDVDSLMSVSTDVGTPQTENIVATGLAGQMLRGEMASSGRKDTNDSDVFAPSSKAGEDEEEAEDKGQDLSFTAEGQDGATFREDRKRQLKFSLNSEGQPIIVPNGPVADEDLLYLGGGEGEGNGGAFGHGGFSKDALFSPVDHSREDRGFVDMAENIVAESIAAALQMSTGASRHGDECGGGEGLRPIGKDSVVSPENMVAANLSASILHEGSDCGWQPGIWSNRGDSGGNRELEMAKDNVVSGNIAAQLIEEAESELLHSSDKDGDSGARVKFTSLNQNEKGGDAETGRHESSSNADQSVSDAALNELAYEIAHDLIQNVLENFPEISSQYESQDKGSETTAKDGQDEEKALGSPRRVGVVDNKEVASLWETDASLHTGTKESLEGRDGWASQGHDPRKLSSDSSSSASTGASDRKWSRDTDSAMTIVEGQVVTSFPGRQELEDDIKSFPGRKFSKSEDFPARRFSREEHASRRTSRIGETQPEGGEFDDIKVAPEGLETEYLPNMDPLQGNMDIIDASFTKITDSDKEVVEGESFRKVSGQEFGISDQFHEGDNEEEEAEGEKRGSAEGNVAFAGGSYQKQVGQAERQEHKERGIMKKETGGEEPNSAEEAKPSRTKRKIRVSFSEDLEDELGDLNSAAPLASASSHSQGRPVFRSPPPLSQDEEEDVFATAERKAGGAASAVADVDHQVSVSSGTGGGASGVAGAGNVAGDVSSGVSPGDETLPRVSPPTSVVVQPVTRNDVSNTQLAGQPFESCTTQQQQQQQQQQQHDDTLVFFQSPETHDPNPLVAGSPSVSKRESLPSCSATESPYVDPPCDDPFVNPDPCTDPPACSDVTLPTPACDNNVALSVAHPVAAAAGLSPSPAKTGAQEPTETASDSARLPQVSAIEPATFDPLTAEADQQLSPARHSSRTSVGSVKGVVYSEEWQDDDIAGIAAQSGMDMPEDDHHRKRIVPDPNFARHVAEDDEQDNEDDDDDDDDDDLGADNGSDIGDLEWERRRLLQEEDDTPIQMPMHPSIQPTLSQEGASYPSHEGEGGRGREAEDDDEARQRWKRVSVSGFDFNIDMQAVEPYRSVLSHGGYYAEGLNAIIVFYGCNLPSRRSDDYSYVMNHLFHYVVHTLEELVADDYVIIYFHGSTPRHKMPGLGWLRRCYQSIDRRLKKNLKGLFLVHPTLWLRTIVTMTRPFISSKFSSKLRFVKTLEELNTIVPMNNVTIPDSIAHYDIYHRHLPSPPTTPGGSPAHRQQCSSGL